MKSFPIPSITSLPAILLLLLTTSSLAHAAPILKVSDDHRHLVFADNTPFFYLGDTAWELFHRLDREEADAYLTDRAQKGFTVIQAVALAELDGLNTPNPYGEKPLIDNDPSQPNPNYFKHVDHIVQKAADLGMFIGFLPTWGDKFNKQWGTGPVVFTPENAAAYGQFLGERYKDQPVIWILGGDRNPETSQHLEIIRAMAAGLEKGDGGNHLMTYHPMGGSCSADWFHNDKWLDFNMFQSGHGNLNIHNHEKTLATRQKTPVKPVLDGEPRYEDHPVGWDPKNGWFDEWDVRQAAYWSMLSGAAGHTYGNHNIWQMWQPGRNPISSARTPWQKAITHPGAQQLGYMRTMLESLDWQTMTPRQDILTSDGGKGPEHIRAALSPKSGFALVYSPMGKEFEVKIPEWAPKPVKAQWFDPRTSERHQLGSFPSGQATPFTPPSNGRGNDWLLILTTP